MNRAPSFVIVADDLSGACDTAAGFLGTGSRVVVTWGDPAHAFDALADVGVLAIDADTRLGSAPEAGRRTGAVVAAARTAGAAGIYKKMDSTLRGHYGHEIAAALEAWGPGSLAVVAPAFPETGRTTVGGRQRAWGREVPRPPITDGLAVAGVLAAGVALGEVRGGALRGVFAASQGRGCAALVCDAETDVDLREISRAGLALGRHVVWVGSGGLARVLARELFSAAIRTESTDPLARRSAVPVAAGGPVLVVVGSGNDVARRQAANVTADAVGRVNLPTEILMQGESRQWDERRADLKAHLGAGHDVLVTMGEEGGAAVEDERLSPRLADLLAPFGDVVGGVVVTGGETAAHVFRSWGITGIELAGEVEPGVPIGWSIGRRRIAVVTKAGGFGDGQTLERARLCLQTGGAASVADEERNQG